MIWRKKWQLKNQTCEKEKKLNNKNYKLSWRFYNQLVILLASKNPILNIHIYIFDEVHVIIHFWRIVLIVIHYSLYCNLLLKKVLFSETFKTDKIYIKHHTILLCFHLNRRSCCTFSPFWFCCYPYIVHCIRIQFSKRKRFRVSYFSVVLMLRKSIIPVQFVTYDTFPSVRGPFPAQLNSCGRYRYRSKFCWLAWYCKRMKGKNTILKIIEEAALNSHKIFEVIKMRKSE